MGLWQRPPSFGLFIGLHFRGQPLQSPSLLRLPHSPSVLLTSSWPSPYLRLHAAPGRVYRRSLQPQFLTVGWEDHKGFRGGGAALSRIKTEGAIGVLVQPTGKVSRSQLTVHCNLPEAYLSYFITQRRSHPPSSEFYFPEPETVPGSKGEGGRKVHCPHSRLHILCLSSVSSQEWVLLLENTDHAFLPHVLFFW